MNSSKKEKKLLKSFVKGDKSSFFELYKIYRKKVFSLIYNFVRNKEITEDLFQKTFFKLYKNRSKFNPKKPLWPYLKRIAINTTYSYFRRKKFKVSIENIPEPSTSGNETNIAEKDIVNHILEELPPNQRIAIILKKFEGYSLKEMAEELQISVKAVESRLSRATKNIIKIYKNKIAKDKVKKKRIKDMRGKNEMQKSQKFVFPIS